jgi:hypothetical protein
MTAHSNGTRFHKHRRVLIRCIKEGVSEVNTGVFRGEKHGNKVNSIFLTFFPYLFLFSPFSLHFYSQKKREENFGLFSSFKQHESDYANDYSCNNGNCDCYFSAYQRFFRCWLRFWFNIST